MFWVFRTPSEVRKECREDACSVCDRPLPEDNDEGLEWMYGCGGDTLHCPPCSQNFWKKKNDA